MTPDDRIRTIVVLKQFLIRIALRIDTMPPEHQWLAQELLHDTERTIQELEAGQGAEQTNANVDDPHPTV